MHTPWGAGGGISVLERIYLRCFGEGFKEGFCSELDAAGKQGKR